MNENGDLGCEVVTSGTDAAIAISDLAQNLDELDRLEVIVEDKLAAGNSAVDVARRSGKKKVGMSRHEISPMRGRDNPILPILPHKSTNVNVAPSVADGQAPRWLTFGEQTMLNPR